MGAESMHAIDAAWLHMDRPTNLMVVNTLVWTERPLDEQRLLEVLEDRLVRRFRRFRQRVSDPTVTAGALSAPLWVDDPDFGLARHVHLAPLPAPGDLASLQLATSALATRPLPRERPLWELHLLTGYGRGSALLLRTHHAIADGVALVQVLLSMTDPVGADTHVGQLPLRIDDRDRPSARTLGGVVTAATRAVALVANAAGSLGSQARASIRDPRTVRELTGLALNDTTMVRKLGFALAAERNPLQGPLVADKRVAWTPTVPLSEIKALGAASGRTVNDVMLAVITGAFRRQLDDLDCAVDDVVVIVPVNLRAAQAPLPSGLGNNFGLVFVPLPTGEADPLRRDARVKERMDRIKGSREGVFIHAMLQVMGQIPRGLQNAWIDSFASKATAIVTNISGPSHEVQVAGVPVAGAMVWVPVTGPVGLGLSIVSWAGQVSVGLICDAQLMPDPQRFLALVGEELDRMRASATPWPERSLPPAGR